MLTTVFFVFLFKEVCSKTSAEYERHSAIAELQKQRYRQATPTFIRNIKTASFNLSGWHRNVVWQP